MKEVRKQNHVKVAIVDNDDLLRGLIEMMLNDESGFECVGSFRCCDEALQGFIQGKPDVILVDLDLAVNSCVECIRLIKEFNPGLEILMLSARTDSNIIVDSLHSGAYGYIEKGFTPAQLVDAIRNILAGYSEMNREVARKISHQFRLTESNLFSKPEKEILSLTASGETEKEIARLLVISRQTVKHHIRNIYRKLELAETMQLTTKMTRSTR